MSSGSASGSESFRGRGRGRARLLPRGSSSGTSSVGGDMSSLSGRLSSVTISSSSGRQISPEEAAKIAAAAAATVPEAQMDIISTLKPKMPFGTAGKVIELFTNHFEIDFKQGVIGVNRYEIKISRPGSERKIDRDVYREVFWKAVTKFPELFGPPQNLVYDDVSCLWSAKKLRMERSEMSINMLHEYTQRPEYNINIKWTASFIVDVRRDDPTRCVTVQFLDALLTQKIRCPLLDISKAFYPFGRAIYLCDTDVEESARFKRSIGAGMEAWNGLHGAVKVGASGKTLYNCDVVTSVFAKMKMSILEFFIEVINDARREKFNMNDLRDPEKTRRLALDERSRKKLKTGLTGLQLCLTYGDERARTRHFKFVDVGQPACVVRFVYKEPDQEGRPGGEYEMTVEEYFYRIKRIELNFPYLPVLQVGPRNKKIFIPMELLIISGKPQKIKKNLTEFQKSALLRWCAYPPNDRMSRIHYMLKRQDVNDSDFVENYDVTLCTNFLKIKGRVLTPPKIATELDDINKYMYVEVKDGSWKSSRFTRCHDNVVFCVVSVEGCMTEQQIEAPLSVLMRACEIFGIQLATRDRLFENWDPREMGQLPALMRYFKDETRKYFDNAECIVIFLMPRKDPYVYSAIKQVCDLEEGIACQCLLSQTFVSMARNRPETSATAYNISLKVNVKMGGINNRIYPSSHVWTKFVDRNSPTLHVGVDVTHPGRRGNSIASVVANIDVEASRYEASVKVQLPSEERIVYMVDAMIQRLLAFYTANKVHPEHIIIYRDGISESEFMNTAREEIGSVQAACMKLDEAYKPTIAYVVVQKRHHTRFFVTRPEDGVGKCGNIPPGTVVEEEVTSQSYADFFLASHMGAIGTTRPCHYYVLYDSWDCTADEWQELLYSLCHLYCRCSKSVSLPTPVYYAHLACARASVHSSALATFGSSQSEYGHGRSKTGLETTRTLQSELSIAETTPKMYFV